MPGGNLGASPSRINAPGPGSRIGPDEEAKNEEVVRRMRDQLASQTARARSQDSASALIRARLSAANLLNRKLPPEERLLGS